MMLILYIFAEKIFPRDKCFDLKSDSKRVSKTIKGSCLIANYSAVFHPARDV